MVAVYQTVRRHSQGLEYLKSVAIFSGCGTGSLRLIQDHKMNAYGYGMDGPRSNPGEGQDFPHLSRPALLYSGCRVLPRGVKRPGRGFDHPRPSTAEVKERV